VSLRDQEIRERVSREAAWCLHTGETVQMAFPAYTREGHRADGIEWWYDKAARAGIRVVVVTDRRILVFRGRPPRAWQGAGLRCHIDELLLELPRDSTVTCEPFGPVRTVLLTDSFGERLFLRRLGFRKRAARGGLRLT